MKDPGGRVRPVAVERPLGVAVIGYGYWGPKLARNLAQVAGCRLTGICDAEPERLAAAAEIYPDVRLSRAADDLVGDPSVDAVVISTPVSTHHRLALESLKAGKHVFVEKPLTRSVAEAHELVDEAATRGLVLMAGHVFLYTGAVREARELVAAERFGELRYYDSLRLNSVLFEQDVNALWDLAVHDLSILDYLVAERPCAVSATGVSHRDDGLESTAYLTVFFESGLLAHIGVNWLAPEKVRRTVIGGTRQMIVYDDLEPIEKLRVFDRGISYNGRVPSAGIGDERDGWAPALDATEALGREMEDFVGSIVTGRAPIADGAGGRRVVELLEAASRSLRERGRPVELRADG
jgi:predicted dehydrogenase